MIGGLICLGQVVRRNPRAVLTGSFCDPEIFCIGLLGEHKMVHFVLSLTRRQVQS
jgi:hypothetical protein